MLTGVARFTHKVQQMQGQPTEQCDNAYLHEEKLIYIACIEVLLQEDYAHEVYNACCYLNQEHLETHIVDLSVDIQDFYEN